MQKINNLKQISALKSPIK